MQGYLEMHGVISGSLLRLEQSVFFGSTVGTSTFVLEFDTSLGLASLWSQPGWHVLKAEDHPLPQTSTPSPPSPDSDTRVGLTWRPQSLRKIWK